jgi:hypothetical protein
LNTFDCCRQAILNVRSQGVDEAAVPEQVQADRAVKRALAEATASPPVVSLP